MKKILVFFLGVFLFVPTSLMAQDTEVDGDEGDDVESNFNVGIEKKLTKKLNVAIEGEFRTRDDFSTVDRWSLSPSLEYKFMKHLKLTVGGAYVDVNNRAKEKYRTDGSLKWIRNSYWAPRYRGFAALTGDVDFGRFNFALRERYQITYRSKYTATRDYYTRSDEYNYSDDDIRESETNQVFRSRLMVSYDIRHCAVDPFASVEMTNDLVNDFSVAKMRYAVGVDWKINKHHLLEFNYMYQNCRGDDGEDDANSHIIGISYKYKF